MAVFYTEGHSGIVETCKMAEAFPFLRESGHIVCLVGAGGKTSLLYEMAHFSASQGLKTLVTTTTHIVRPQNSVYAENWHQVERLWDRGFYAVIGSLAPGDKLSMLPEEMLFPWMDRADIVLIEADGSKRMPVKVPGPNEPVILPQCDIVIGVLGLSGLNRPLKQVCFRLERAMELLKGEGDSYFTEVQAAQILSSEQGTRKHVGQRNYSVVLNQCDSEEKMEQGQHILQLLAQEGIPGIMSCFKESDT